MTVEQMWEQVKWAMVNSAREVCGSMRMWWWNNVDKASVERKEAVWKKLLGVRDEVTKER